MEHVAEPDAHGELCHPDERLVVQHDGQRDEVAEVHVLGYVHGARVEVEQHELHRLQLVAADGRPGGVSAARGPGLEAAPDSHTGGNTAQDDSGSTNNGGGGCQRPP